MARTKAKIPAPKPPIDVDEAGELRLQGWSYADIGRELGYRASSIRRRLLEAGVQAPAKRSLRSSKGGARLYSIWGSMRDRCRSMKNDQYANVGGKGIRVCAAWESFDVFHDWARSSGYKPNLWLIRKSPSRNFTPGNCRWGKRSEIRQKSQKGVRRLHNRPLTEVQWNRAEKLHRENGLSCPEVAKRLGVAHGTILYGLKARGLYVQKPRSTPERSRIYKSWTDMRRRCSDPRDNAFVYYGEKGVRVCKEWEEFESFHLWALESGWKPGLCLTRRGKAKVFSPKNCLWVTRADAARMAKHPDSSIPARWTITAFGETKGPTEWSRDPRCSVTLAGLLGRLHKGWDVESAISETHHYGAGPPSPCPVTAFGLTKGAGEWSRDPRCKVSLVTLLRRLEKGYSPEEAISSAPFKCGRRS